MSLTRRLLALLMAVLMTISLFPLQTFAADGEEPDPPAQAEETAAESGGEAQETVSETDATEDDGQDDVTVIAEGVYKGYSDLPYVLTSDGTLTISGSGSMPAHMNNRPGWYEYRAQIRSIVIGDGITAIGYYGGGTAYLPFADLNNVKEITFLRSSCPKLDRNDVFSNLSALESVNVPAEGFESYVTALSSNNRLPSKARIYAAGEMNDFVIQDGVLVSYQGSDTVVTIPDTVAEIGTGAFLNCRTMTAVEIPDGVTRIGASAFNGCSGLTGALELPDSLTAIGASAFSGCTGLTGDLIIPDNVITIGTAAFYNCTGLNGTLRLSAAITQIPSNVFAYCGFTGSLIIPEGVKSIEYQAFYQCKGLTGDLTIPDSLTTIGNFAFMDCTGFDGTLHLSESLTSIGTSAFSGCRFTGSLAVPDSLKTINSYAFRNMSGISSLTMGKNVTACGDAFSGCIGVQELTFTGMTPPTFSVFPGGSSLRTVFVPAAAYQSYAQKYSSSLPANAVLRCSDYSGDFLVDDGVLVAYLGDAEEIVFPENLTITEIADGAFQNLKTVKSVAIPESVSKIGSAAFKGAGITEISLPATLTQIGSEAFSGCVSLTSVALPEGLTLIGEKAFYNCSALSGTLSVPSGIQTVPAEAFYGCKALAALILNEGIQTIGKSAFSGCSGLEGELEIPSTVTSLGDYAFSGCSKLSGTLTIPGTLTTIGQNAFAACSALTELSITDGVKTIGMNAFYNCTGLTGTLTFPDSVTMINSRAFYNCSKLSGLVLPDSITYLYSECFYNCSGLTGELVIPDQVTGIGEQAFRGCGNLTSIVLGTSVRSIQGTSRGNYSPFSGCAKVTELSFKGTTIPTVSNTSSPFPGSVKTVFVPAEAYDAYVAAYQGYLPSTARFRILGAASDFMIENGVLKSYIGEGGDVVIPDGVTEIAENAFKNVQTITSLTFPSTLQLIGDSAFYNCSGLTGSLVIPDGVTTIGASAFSQCTGLTGLVLGENLETIGANAFNQCKGLTGSLVIPDSVSTIGNSAFYNCSGLTELVLGESLETIGASAFYNCGGLAGELVIPDGVTSVGANAFRYNSKITSVVIGTNMAEIGADAFSNCGGVTTITFCPQNPPTSSALTEMSGLTTVYVPKESFSEYADAYTAMLPGNTRLLPLGVEGDFFIEGGKLLCYLGSASTVTVPDTVTVIGPAAFKNCSFLTSITLPEGLTEIGQSAFYGCSGLSAAPELPEHLLTIGNHAFQNCYGMKGALRLPDSLTTIGAGAFQGATRLTSLTLGEDLTEIGEQAFLNCNGLACDLVIPNKVKTISRQAFCNCSKLTGVTFGDHLTTIGSSVFSSCTGLTGDLVIPDSVTSIGASAFDRCSGFTSLTLSKNLTEIGSSAFYSCYKLSGALVIPGGVTTLGKEVFRGCAGFTSLTLHENVTSIGESAFYSCAGLTGELVIPDSVTSIGTSAFYDCNKLTAVTLGRGVAQLYGGTNNHRCPFEKCTSLETLTFLNETPPSIVSNSLKEITNLKSVYVPNAAFDAYRTALSGGLPTGARLLVLDAESDFLIRDGELVAYFGSDTEVEIPEGVTKIGDYAFRGMDMLTTIMSPDSVTEIGTGAFYGCSALSGISFSDQLTKIGASAFYGCTGLTGELAIPGSVTSIGASAFYGCTGLTGDLVIPDSVTSMGESAFYGCSGLDGTLKLSSALTEIPAYAFSACTGLTGDLVIPDSVRTIAYRAFAGMTGIISITFGAHVSEIGTTYRGDASDNPFAGVSGVEEITFLSANVPDVRVGYITLNIFSAMTGLKTVYVPAASYDTYVTAFGNQVPADAVFSTDYMAMKLTGLSAEGLSSHTAGLTWNAHPCADTAGYIVSRNGEVIARVSDTAYTDAGLEPDAEYVYTVCAYASDGRTSPAAEVGITLQRPQITEIRTQNSGNRMSPSRNLIYVSVATGTAMKADETAVVLYDVQGDTRSEIGRAVYSPNLSGKYTAVYTLVWDVADVKEGEHTILAVATDSAGEHAENTAVVTVDKRRPAQIVGVNAITDSTKIYVSWAISKEADTEIYRVYRRASTDPDFIMAAQINDRNTLSYTDARAQKDHIYYYYVVGVNALGEESVPSEYIGATLDPDTEAPVVTRLTPANATYLHGTASFTLKAEDNVSVTRTAFAWSTDNGETWTEFGEPGNVSLDTTALPDGEIRVRGTAFDAAGNESDPLTYVYRIDNTGPEKVTGLAAEATSVTITLNWNDVADDDIRFFRVERQTEDGSFVKQADADTMLGLNIRNLTPDTDYTYRVVGYDLRGNRGTPSEAITVHTAADTTAPVITRILPGSGYYNHEIPLTFYAEDDYSIAALRVQISSDGIVWSDVQSFSYEDVSAKRTQQHLLSLSELPEGALYVRALAADAAGNVSDSTAAAPFTQHMVDRTPPAAPQNVRASGGVGYAEISWTQGEEADLGKYLVYRAESADGEYSLMASGIAAINWFDRTVQEGVTYYYKVAVTDLAGNESAPSNPVSAQALHDSEPPRIVSFYPDQSSALGAGYRSVRVLAADNHTLASIRLEYSTDGETWQQAGEALNLNVSSRQFTVQLPLEALEDGKTVSVRAVVTDLAGNTAEETAQYAVDLTAPVVRSAEAAFDAAEDTVTVTWKGAKEGDLIGYRVYRRAEGSGTEKLIAQRQTVSDQAEYRCTDVDISAQSVRYVYRIEAVDACGNTSSLEAQPLAIPDRSAPKAILQCDLVQEVGVEYRFDASQSRDNGSIESYQMDLGDGTVTDRASIVHVYDKTGEYTVTLTVTDNDGNVSTCTQIITVKERNVMGEAEILVVDDAGKPVPGAKVYFDLGEENEAVRTTNAKGVAVFTAEAGRHTVGCIIADNNWLPAKKDVIIITNKRAVISLTLVRQPIVEGQFEITRMTFEEIVAQGIDVSASENQNLLKVLTRLTYGSQTITTTFVYNASKPDPIGKPIVISTPDGEKRKLVPVVLPALMEGSYTSEAAIAFLDIPASVSFLKEFFDVKLHIINNAASTFSLIDNTVTLNVPDGLSIVPSEATQADAIVTIPEIPGQTTVTLSWILRGDKAGEYPLSADYSGVVSEFNEPIYTEFRSEEPIKVYGLEAVKLRAVVNTALDYDALYFDLSMENVGEAEIYLPKFQDVLKETISSQLNDDAAKQIEVRVLNTILSNASGASQMLGANGTVQALRPGETMTQQFAAYGVIGENHTLSLREAIANIAESYGMPFEIIERRADLYSMDHAAEKVAAIAADADKCTAYHYLLNNANFFYVREALVYSDQMLANLSQQQYDSVLQKLDNMLSASVLPDIGLSPAEQIAAAVQPPVLYLLRDTALMQTTDTLLSRRWLNAADALENAMQEGVRDALSADDLALLDAWCADDSDLGNRSSALRRDGAEGFASRAAEALEAAGMSQSGVTAVHAWLEQSAGDALTSALCAQSPLLTAAGAQCAAIFTDPSVCDEILRMEILGAEMQSLPLRMRQQLREKSPAAAVLESMAEALSDANAACADRLTRALAACTDADSARAVVREVYGTAPTDTLLTAAFGELAAPEKVNVDAMLAAESLLSIALTKETEAAGLQPENDDEALQTIRALRYLISLRLYSERTFADQADGNENIQSEALARINALRGGSYETANAYAADISAELQRYRDDLFATGRTDPNRPAAPTVTIDYRAETTVEQFSGAYEYSFDGTHWTTCSGGTISLEPGSVAKHLRVRARESGSAFSGNIATLVVPARPRIQGDLELVVGQLACSISGLPEGEYAYAFTNDREAAPTFTGQFSPDAQGSAMLNIGAPFLYLALERQADDGHFKSQVRFAMQDNWLRDHENMFITGIPVGTSYESALDHYDLLGLEAMITNADGGQTDVVGTGARVVLKGETFEAVVRGDVTGDAGIDQADLDEMLDHINAAKDLDGAYYRAGQVTGTGDVGIFDLYAEYDYLLTGDFGD